MRSESTIVSEGFKEGTRGAPIMPRDVSLSDSKCWNGGGKWVKLGDASLSDSGCRFFSVWFQSAQRNIS